MLNEKKHVEVEVQDQMSAIVAVSVGQAANSKRPHPNLENLPDVANLSLCKEVDKINDRKVAAAVSAARRASAAIEAVPAPLPLPDVGVAEAPRALAVLFTGFARGDLQRYRRCISRLGGTSVRELPLPCNDSHATSSIAAADVRVVVRCSTSSKKQSRCAGTRTIKYFDALLAGSWILSPEWVLQSNQHGCWLPEADFQVSGDVVGDGGPARHRRFGPCLFAGLRLHFAIAAPAVVGDLPKGASRALGGGSRLALDDEAGPQPSDLERLARRGGAEILSEIRALPEAASDPPYLSAECQKASRKGRQAGTKRGDRPINSASAGGIEPVTWTSSKAAPSASSAWWRRPIVIIPGATSCRASAGAAAAGAEAATPPRGGRSLGRRASADEPCGGGGSGGAGGDIVQEAQRAGWTVLPSSWMLDCISMGEVIPAPSEWALQPAAEPTAAAEVASPRAAAGSRRSVGSCAAAAERRQRV